MEHIGCVAGGEVAQRSEQEGSDERRHIPFPDAPSPRHQGSIYATQQLLERPFFRSLEAAGGGAIANGTAPIDAACERPAKRQRPRAGSEAAGVTVSGEKNAWEPRAAKRCGV